MNFGIVSSAASVLTVGPVLPAKSATALLNIRRLTVPGEVHVAVTSKLEPVAAETDIAHPVAVPLVEKSPAVRPVMLSEMESEYRKTSEERSVAADDHDAVGATVSIVTAVADEVEAGPLFKFASVTASTAMTGITVPSEEQVTEIVKVDPLEVLGENAQPVAVPELEKSALERPEMVSENAIPNEVVRFLPGVAGGVHELTEGFVVSGVQRTTTIPVAPLPPL